MRIGLAKCNVHLKFDDLKADKNGYLVEPMIIADILKAQGHEVDLINDVSVFDEECDKILLLNGPNPEDTHDQVMDLRAITDDLRSSGSGQGVPAGKVRSYHSGT